MSIDTQSSGGRGIVSLPGGTSEWFDLVPGERMRIRLGATDTGGRFTITESIVAPGGSAPLHLHRSADEIFMVTAGTVHFTVADDVVEAPAGTIIVLPRGTAHSFINRAATDARMVAIFTPGGMETMLTAFADTPDAGRAALVERHDTVMVASMAAPETS